jgi:hypothetical protein
MHTGIHSGGTGNHPAFPHANGFNGLWRALPGDEFVLPPSPANGWSPRPVGLKDLRRLDTSNGCQDHTLLPYASASLVLRARTTHGRSPPCHPLARPTLPRPPHPAPYVRDDRDTPLFGRGGMARRNHRFRKNRSDIFFARGLDKNSRTLPVGQITWCNKIVKFLQRSHFLIPPDRIQACEAPRNTGSPAFANDDGRKKSSDESKLDLRQNKTVGQRNPAVETRKAVPCLNHIPMSMICGSW